MDIKVMAFEITLGNGITINTLYDYLISTSGDAIGDRMLYVDNDNEWWRGVLLTSKNIKAFSRLIRSNGTVRLSPEAIQNGELAHFNFFIINPRTRRGYYQYYHGSASLHGFCDVLKKKYNVFRNMLIARECLRVGADINDIPREIRQRFKGFLNYQIVLRRQSFENLIMELRYVKNISFQFVEYIPDQPQFRPLAERAKSIIHRLSFRPHHDRSILERIIDLSRSNVLNDLRGIGITEDGIEKAFKLINEPETLERFDFNNVVLETEFDSSNIHQSMDNAPMIQHLINIANR